VCQLEALRVSDCTGVHEWSTNVDRTAGFFFIIPICATLPPLADVIQAPVGQALPYIFHTVSSTIRPSLRPRADHLHLTGHGLAWRYV